MTGDVRLRRLGQADLPLCLALARERGFSGGAPAWRLAFAAGEIHGAETADGSLAGAAVLLPFAGRVASLAVAVAPRRERRGIARALVAHALAAAGTADVQMHAPGAALAFCERVGFQVVGATVRFAGAPRGSAPSPRGLALRPVGGADLAGILAQDEIAFGAPRRTLLEALLPASARVALATGGGRPVGYGVAWEDGDAVAIGPIVAEDPAAALLLAGHLAAGHALPVRVDVPADRAPMLAWARGAGLSRLGTAALLSRGGRPLPGRRERIHALVTASLA
ncbi:MAG TPA: GNAT family N-acetyltransferase [Anaeromyxobacteraceae bacterium]|nr:GNAT family N-acetyltransferase [Anaeromyxobacteraceae bacterium]